MALTDGFWLLEPSGVNLRPLAAVEADRPGTRFNDGKCDPAGRFWAGTMAYDETPGAGTLYRLDPDGRVEPMLAAVTISNGLAWSLDGRTLYYVDSPTRRVDAFDHDPAGGMLTNRRPFVELGPGEPGVPDGITIDAEGHLWVAFWDGWAVHRYQPDGTLDAVVPDPVARPTSCAFGGVDLADLYVTSASIGLSPAELAEQPHAGGIFRARPGVPGLAPVPFSG
jgi:sugar lactone lactonase YvrE